MKASNVGKKTPKQILDRFNITSLRADLIDETKVLTRYPIGAAEVLILDEDGNGRYLINEPKVTPEEIELYKLLMASLYYSLRPTPKILDPVKYIEDFITESAAELGVADRAQQSYETLRYYISRDVMGYGLLDIPMKDPTVEEVECGGFALPVTVVHRDFTELWRLETNISLTTEEKVNQVVQKLAQKAGKSVTIAHPFVDFMLPQGHRGAVTYSSEISLPGSTFDIRKFPEDPLTVSHMLKTGTISPLMAAYYWLVQEHRGFSLISGAMSSGKTTILNVLLSMLHPKAKILTVEDTPELRVVHRNWIRFITRSAYTLGARDIGLFDLVKLSLRYRPDYIVVGEVRGEEIQSLVQAAAVGHGAMTTFHAESPQAAIVRMRSPPLNVGESFLLLIWAFLQMARVTTGDGRQVRRAVSSVELVPEYTSSTPFKLKTVFQWDAYSDRITPEDPEEVVKNSTRLELVRLLRGWTKDDLAHELSIRAEALQNMVTEKVYNYREVASKLFSFYRTNQGNRD